MKSTGADQCGTFLETILILSLRVKDCEDMNSYFILVMFTDMDKYLNKRPFPKKLSSCSQPSPEQHPTASLVKQSPGLGSQPPSLCSQPPGSCSQPPTSSSQLPQSDPSPSTAKQTHRTPTSSTTPPPRYSKTRTPSRQSKTSEPVDATPKSVNTRYGWAPICLKIGNKIQVNIFCRRSNGKFGPFTAAAPASKVRPWWAAILECEYITDTSKGGDVKKLFVIKNVDNEKAVFRADILNPLLQKVNQFSQKCSALLISSPKLLAAYLSLVSFSESFCSHDSEKHLGNGLSKELRESEVDSLVQLGGSLQDYETFIKAAISSALDVSGGGKEEALNISPAVKRRITDFYNKTGSKKKLTRKEQVEDNYRTMLGEERGLEKSITDSYVNFQSIPVENLSVSPNMFLLMNQVKISEIADSMIDRYDPSQMVLSVVPSDLEAFERDGTSDSFWVIHGRHRYQALKKIQRMNKLQELPGFPSDRTIQCFVLKVNAPSLSNYFNVRSNDLSTAHQSATTNEELFYVYRGLLESTKDPHESLEIVLKICHSRHMGTNEIAVYNKIVYWPIQVLDQLISVLKLFQGYQTKDANAKGDQARLRRRQPKILTKSMFTQLGNCSAALFSELHNQIISNDLSLKELLQKSEQANLLVKTEKKVASCAGVKDFEALQAKFPEKFNKDIVKSFSGAEIMGRKRNRQGQRLKVYVKSVQLGKPHEEPVKFETYDNWSELSSDKLKCFDVVVLNIGKSNLKCVQYWIDSLSQECSVKDHFCALLILESEADLGRIYKQLEFWQDKPDFVIKQCLFQNEISVPSLDRMDENATFCVIFGKINIFRDQVSTLNGVIDQQLAKVVVAVTPPSGKVAYVTRGDKKVINMHSNQDEGVQVVYFVTKTELPKFEEKFLIQAPSSDLVDKVTKSKEKDESDESEYDEDVEDEDQESGSGSDTDSEFKGVKEGSGGKEDSELFVESSDLTKQSSTSNVSY